MHPGSTWGGRVMDVVRHRQHADAMSNASFARAPFPLEAVKAAQVGEHFVLPRAPEDWGSVCQEGAPGLEPLRLEHAALVARLLDDAQDAHWTGIAIPDPQDPVQWVRERLGSGSACFLVVHRGQALGYAQLRLAAGVASPAVWLTRTRRHMGHGTQVIQGLADLARRAGLCALVTAIRQDNAASRAAFRRCGWIETDWRARAPFADCGFWALAVGQVASRTALVQAVAQFYRASTPLLTLYREVDP
jgi:L-amino acid N-acyltransferase YncA